jgi:hypothetical protein
MKYHLRYHVECRVAFYEICTLSATTSSNLEVRQSTQRTDNFVIRWFGSFVTSIVTSNPGVVSNLEKKLFCRKNNLVCCFLACGLYYKSFTIVIYDRNESTIKIYNCNDSGQYYKTINYNPKALARIVNYDSSIVNKWWHNLEHTLRS